MLGAVQEIAEQVASIVRYIPDPASPVPGSEWTLGETAAHIALGQALFTELVEGLPSPFGTETIPTAAIVDEFAAVNRRLLGQFPERDGVRLSDLINEGTRSLVSALRGCPDGHRVHCHFGSLDLNSFASYALCHLLLHGYPLAQALGRHFSLSPEHALLTVPFLKAVLPLLSDRAMVRGLTGCLEVQIRGGPRFAVCYEADGIRVEDECSQRPHCHLVADPAAFFLVGTHLMTLGKAIARGDLVSWGRRPWLAVQSIRAVRVP